MSKLKFRSFTKKLNILFGNENTLIEQSPEKSTLIKIFTVIFFLKNNKKFKYLNKNKICLYDTCLFIAYTVSRLIFSSSDFTGEEQENSDNELIVCLVTGFDFLFKCPQITDIEVNISRFEFYDYVIAKYGSQQSENDIIAAFNEFAIIIKRDIICKDFKVFDSNSPLYLLRSTEENTLCELESRYALDVALDFYNEITKKF